MKITVLGTGGSAGLPQIGGADGFGDWGKTDPNEPLNARTRSSIVIGTSDGRNLLVDTGPEMRLQLTRAGVGRVESVFYTHAHADHISGLDDIRILNRILGAPMPIYTDEATLAELRQRFDYAFRPHNGGFFGRPVLEPHVVSPGQIVEILGEQVTIFDQDHGFARSLGIRVRDFAYCTDVVRLDEAAFEVLGGLELLIVDCFTLAGDHPTHAGLPTVLSWVERLKPKRTVLTHMGPEMDYRGLRDILPPWIEPGYDGMAFELA